MRKQRPRSAGSNCAADQRLCFRHICKELQVGKSGGSDFALNEFFKYGINEMVNYLYKLFNVIFEKRGIFQANRLSVLSFLYTRKGT